tara:strand:- start:950 stop:1210 length:261 start_codon:yes stop_codon:yes gene_type:complete
MDDIISGVAFGLGFIEMYGQVCNVEKIDVNLKRTVILGILTSSLWFVYQYRKHGLNVTTLYTTTGLIVQLYVLNAILVKEDKKLKD